MYSHKIYITYMKTGERRLITFDQKIYSENMIKEFAINMELILKDTYDVITYYEYNPCSLTITYNILCLDK